MTRRPCSHSPPDIWFFQMLNKNVCLWQQATIKITRSLLSSPLASTINCSLASQALLEVTRLDHSVGITLLLLVCATYTYVLFFMCILFVVNRTMTATLTERLQHHFRHWHAYKRESLTDLQAWRNLSNLSWILPHSPVAMGGGFCGVSPSKTKFQAPQLKYKAL